MKNISVILIIGVVLFLGGVSCDTNPYKSGEVLYTNFCSNCHGQNGEGLVDLYPPIANADYLKNHAYELACMIRKGMSGLMTVNGKPYNEIMPPYPKLDDVAITNIANYINYKWPYRDDYTTITEVREQLEECE